MQTQWLQRPGVFRCVLIEVDYSEGAETKTAYFARGNFRSAGTDTPAYTPYRDVIVGGLTFTSAIDSALFGHSDSGLGDVELLAIAETEQLLTKAVAGHSVRIYIGEEGWKKSQFYPVATFISDTPTASGNTIRLPFREFAEDLAEPVLNQRTADGVIIPLCLGRAFNITPVLINAANHTYQFNLESSEAVSAVRFNGDLVADNHYSVDLTTSTITFTTKPIGQITMDVDGVNHGGWKRSATEIIQYLFPTAQVAKNVPDYLLGLYLNDSQSKEQLLNDITTSVGAYWRYDVNGILQVNRFSAPTGKANSAVTADNNQLNSRSIVLTLPPSKEVSIGYGRNYTPMSALAGKVHEQQPELAERLTGETLTVTLSSPMIANTYAKAAMVNAPTLLVDKADANGEASRRLAIGSIPRVIYQTQQMAAGFSLGLGQEVKMTTPGLNGNTAIVTRKDYDMLNDTITLELWQ